MKITKKDLIGMVMNFISVIEDNQINGMANLLNRMKELKSLELKNPGCYFDAPNGYVLVEEKKMEDKKTYVISYVLLRPDIEIPIEIRLIPANASVGIILRAEEQIDRYSPIKTDEFGNILQGKIFDRYGFSLITNELAKLCGME